MLRTAVVSDLHLGTRTRADILRWPEPREVLASALVGTDQLVLLGDAFELRDRPLAEALAAARPFLETIGATLRNGRVILVPGNHDHRLAWEALDLCPRRPGRGLGIAQEVRVGRSGALGAIRGVLGVELLVAYPGFWIHDGVWATHGHYLDAHSEAPTLECIAARVMAAARRHPAPRRPVEYEQILSPTYNAFFAIAQRRRLRPLADEAKSLLRRAETLVGVRGESPAGVWEERRTLLRFLRLLGDERLGTAPGELGRPGLRPFQRVLDSLGVEAARILFGHTHRTGPLPGDPPALWRTAAGTELINTGSWVYEPAYVGEQGDESPYWPGTVTIIDDDGPPVVRRLVARLPGLERNAA
jgi:hypothetical protein